MSRNFKRKVKLLHEVDSKMIVMMAMVMVMVVMMMMIIMMIMMLMKMMRMMMMMMMMMASPWLETSSWWQAGTERHCP